ncbi:MAG TPA: AMIN domain-containing protein, partial [Firmicutes bacterium]|nr:AMIN domain-containing protein [Bacillota bacterium]
PQTLKITGEGLEARVYPDIEVVAGEVTLLRSVPAAGAATPLPMFRIISPRPGTRTSRDRVNVAIHTDPDNKVFINGEETHVYKTGISVLDNVPIEPGQNRFELAVETPAGFRISRIRWVERTPPEPLPILPALPLQIEEESLQPRSDLLVQAGDQIPVRFKGSPGHDADFRIGRRTRWQPMTELPAEEQRGIRGIYSGVYVVQPGDAFEEEELTIRLRRSREVQGATRSPSRLQAAAGGKITTLSACVPMVAEVTADAADLRVGLGEVRLGGPILSTVPKGTRLELTGKVGRNWRVRLSETVEAWVSEWAVRVLPPGTPPARDFLTSFTVSGDEKYDMLSIPYSQRVPFRIRPVPEPNRLEIDLYGVTANTTWITIQEKAEGIKRVDWEQVEKDLYRLTVDLNYPQLWGYDATAENNVLRVRIKRPPELAAPPQSPVAGLTIAVEAGHGGPRNLGAVGLSGSREKDVNYGTATRLVALLEAAGAEVVMMRRGDETISLGDRIKRAVEGEADILISIHANAAGSSGGYLRVSGVSTYYKYTPWRPLADRLYQRLLEIGLNPWNVIGSFNYRPCLVTEMPAVLVELAFMSHPGDEELLVDPDFQQKMAEAIFRGLEDYLEEQRSG